MSGKTAVGAGGVALGHDEADPQGIAPLVTETLDGDEPTAIVYRENTGTLDEPVDEWHRYEDVSDLPDGTVDGWDELYVYTATHVYRWVGVGFGGTPEKVPRDPESLPAGD
jgi:hypothetical protein